MADLAGQTSPQDVSETQRSSQNYQTFSAALTNSSSNQCISLQIRSHINKLGNQLTVQSIDWKLNAVHLQLIHVKYPTMHQGQELILTRWNLIHIFPSFLPSFLLPSYPPLPSLTLPHCHLHSPSLLPLQPQVLLVLPHLSPSLAVCVKCLVCVCD